MDVRIDDPSPTHLLHTLPERFQRAYRLKGATPAERRRYAKSIERLRGVEPRLGRRLRYLPPYLAAERRLAGQTGPDLLGDWLGRLYIGSPRR